MQVVVESLLTTYKDSGKGKGVLLLHGWGDTMATFSQLEESLSSYYRVVSVDLPGFGKTQAPSQVWGLNEYANFVASFISKIDFNPYVIIAHSNGGDIAIRGLAAGKLSAEKLVLLASAGIRGQYKGRVKVIRLITKVGKIATAPLPASVKNKLRRMVYNTVGSDMLVAEHLQETFKKVITDDVRTDATKLKIPTLLIYGDKDEQTPPKLGQLLRDAIPKSKLVIVEGAGHHVHQDEPEQVLGHIEELLR